MDNKPQPVAMKLAEMLTADEWPGSVTLVSYAQECVAELLTQHAHITELESQLAQRFDAADVATAAAQGFRDGVASLTAQAADSVGRDADRIVKWSDRIQRAHPKSEPEFWPDALRVKYMADEISDLRAARVPADSELEDAARLDFIERHPERSLRHRKGRWAFLGFTNYEYDLHQSLRDAVDAAMLEEKV